MMRDYSEDKNINKNNFIDINLAKDIDKGLDIGDFVEYDLEFEIDKTASLQ